MNKKIEILVGKGRPAETEFYEQIHKAIKASAGRLTPAQINGLLFQIQLEVLDVFGTGDYQ